MFLSIILDFSVTAFSMVPQEDGLHKLDEENLSHVFGVALLVSGCLERRCIWYVWRWKGG